MMKNFTKKKNTANNKSYKTAKKPNRKPKKASNRNTGRRVPFGDVLIGRVDRNDKGHGYLIVDGLKDDPFIDKADMNGAFHGDTVEIKMIGFKKKGGEAKVIKIIERGFEKIVGTYFYNNYGGFVVPDNSRIADKVYIDTGCKMNAENKDKVWVKLDFNSLKKHSAVIKGEVIEVLGKVGDVGVDIVSIIRNYNLIEYFKDAVLKEAKTVGVAVGGIEKKSRRDLTNETIFTIDGDDSKDFDDAVSVKICDNGHFELGVHIADVTHYVKEDSKLDKEAFKRATSVYFVDRVLPMLPEILSNDICSLNENVERLTLSCIMEIDNSGETVRYEIVESVIKSKARLTYSKVSRALEDGISESNFETTDFKKYTPLLKTLKVMQNLAAILYNKRAERGNIEFDLPECQIVLDKDKKAIDIVKKPRLLAHHIIEEFMLAANETVAKFLGKINAPGVFRVHENPPSDKVENLKDFLKAIAVEFVNIDAKPSPSDFRQLLLNVKGKNEELAVTKTALRTMAKAIYSPEDLGHFGLASKNYCHFTSPIRRYPDLAVHRIVKEFLKNGKDSLKRFQEFSKKAASQSSTKERLAEKAERDVVDLKKAEFMKDKIGFEYEGIVSGVTEWGFFVELDNTVEGLVRVQSLSGHSFEFIERSMMLTNKIESYRIGNKVKVKVESVNASRIEFVVVE